MTPVERVEAFRRIIKTRAIPCAITGCWMWLGATTSRPDGNGYGQFQLDRVKYRAPRAAYEAFVGEIPPGLQVLHTCDTPRCCNPEHLFVGTRSDNMRDMTAKGRNGMHRRPEKSHFNFLPIEQRVRGDTHGMVKVADRDVEMIRASFAPTRQLAAYFGVHRSTIQRIRAGKSRAP